jgi:hypothetical protein
MRGTCLLSRRSEDVSIFFGRASVHCEDLLDYWFQDCQRSFVEQFGGRNPPSKRCIQLLVTGCVDVSFHLDYLYLVLSYLIFSCCQLPFCEFPKHTTALHYRYDMQMYCTFALFVNQHFSGLTASGTHCITLQYFKGEKLLKKQVLLTLQMLECTSCSQG